MVIIMLITMVVTMVITSIVYYGLSGNYCYTYSCCDVGVGRIVSLGFA